MKQYCAWISNSEDFAKRLAHAIKIVARQVSGNGADPSRTTWICEGQEPNFIIYARWEPRRSGNVERPGEPL